MRLLPRGYCAVDVAVVVEAAVWSMGDVFSACPYTHENAASKMKKAPGESRSQELIFCHSGSYVGDCDWMRTHLYGRRSHGVMFPRRLSRTRSPSFVETTSTR